MEVDLYNEAVSALAAAGGSKTRAAEALGIPRSTFYGRISAGERSDGSLSVKAAKKFSVRHEGDVATIWSYGDEVLTVDDAIAKANIDLDEFYILSQECNSYPTSMKLATGDKKTGTYSETPHQVHNWQIKIKVKRKAPKPIQDAIKDLLNRLPKKISLPKVSRPRKRQTHLMEISLFDAHFGKLCWGKETGTNYDLEIATKDFTHAVTDLLELNAGYAIDRVVFPIGNDFFHVDNWLGTTAKGTVVDSTDDRFQKVFRAGCEAVEFAILRAREVADVDVVWVPGNHDPATSWYMSEFLRAVFRGDQHVRVHNGERMRKYIHYGVNLLGYTHGDTCALDKLPMLMMTDEPSLTGQCTHRAWRTGHRHTKKKIKFVTAGDTFNGFHIDVLPSISGTDLWHYMNGFVGNARTAEAWLWSKEGGYRTHTSVPTITQVDDWENPASQAINLMNKGR